MVLWVMISGPYSTGAATAADRDRNLAALNEAAWAVLQRGHVPVIGVNMALPVIAAAGWDRFDEIMMPLSLALARRCDACLRIGGASVGADLEAEYFHALGKPVFTGIDDIPAA